VSIIFRERREAEQPPSDLNDVPPAVSMAMWQMILPRDPLPVDELWSGKMDVPLLGDLPPQFKSSQKMFDSLDKFDEKADQMAHVTRILRKNQTQVFSFAQWNQIEVQCSKICWFVSYWSIHWAESYSSNHFDDARRRTFENLYLRDKCVWRNELNCNLECKDRPTRTRKWAFYQVSVRFQFIVWRSAFNDL